MATIITKDCIVCHIIDRPSCESDGNEYKVLETGFKSQSEQTAINNGLAYIRKQFKKLQRIRHRQKKLGITPLNKEIPLKGIQRKRFYPVYPELLEENQPPVKVIRKRRFNVIRKRKWK